MYSSNSSFEKGVSLTSTQNHTIAETGSICSQNYIPDLFKLYEEQLDNFVHDAVILLDQDFTILRWNRAAEVLYEWKAEEAVGRQLAEILPTQYTDSKQTGALANLFELGSWKGEVIHKSKSKKKLYVLSSMFLVKNREGLTQGIVLVNSLVSDKQNSQPQLDVASQHLSYHVNNTPLGYIQWDGQFCLQVWSLQAEKMLGWSAEEVRGKNISDSFLIHQDDLGQFNHTMIEVIANRLQRFKFIIRNVTKDGSILYCEWYNSVLRDENSKLVSIVSFIKDITEEESNTKKIRKIAESAPGILYQYTRTKDGQEMFNFISKETKEFLKDFTDGVNKDYSWIWNNINEEDLAELKKKTLISEKNLSRFKHEFRVKLNNKIIWFKMVSHPKLNNEDGSITWTGVLTDITSQKKVTEDLEQRNFELNNFAYKVSHDLRAPLCSIAGLVELLRKEDDPAFYFRYLELMDTSIKRLDQFILNVLSHIRVSSSKLTMGNVNLKEIINTTCKDLSYTPFYHRINKVINLYDENIYGDENLLREILRSLISNGIKYQDQRKEKSFIKIAVKCNAEHIFIEYKDNGLGIEEQHLPKIFDMFYRASEQSKGVGIGLYILKQAVEKMEGKVEVKSQINEGTIFSIVLPNKVPLQ